MKILKIALVSVGLLILLLIGYIFGSIMYFSWQDSKFYDIKIPEEYAFEKPIEYLSLAQVDSLEKLAVDEPKILVVGTGYSGYDFYMWHKSSEAGEIYIKAFEITNEQPLSVGKLSRRTKQYIGHSSKYYNLYKGRTTIDEGTFEKYYPARFELWFNSAKNGTEIKLTEKSYLIDGWDR